MTSLYRIAGAHFHSRLWACTAQNFRSGARALSAAIAANVIRASGTDILITYVPSVSDLRTLQENACSIEEIETRIPAHQLVELVCTNLSRTSQEAVAKALHGMRVRNAALVKLEVLENFVPLDAEVLAAAKQLRDLGYTNVVPLVSCDELIAREVVRLGVPALRLLASTIGSGRGIASPNTVRRICEASAVPVIVEGGIGTPEQAAQALHLGATAVLVNSAIITSHDPVRAATAFRAAVENASSLTANAGSAS